jgi:hypothetical protein
MWSLTSPRTDRISGPEKFVRQPEKTFSTVSTQSGHWSPHFQCWFEPLRYPLLNTREEEMRRREFITLLGGAAVAWPLAAGAQQPIKMRRIGVLWHGSNAEEEAIYLAALRQGLLDFGYVEGQNIVLEMRFPGAV